MAYFYSTIFWRVYCTGNITRLLPLLSLSDTAYIVNSNLMDWSLSLTPNCFYFTSVLCVWVTRIPLQAYIARHHSFLYTYVLVFSNCWCVLDIFTSQHKRLCRGSAQNSPWKERRTIFYLQPHRTKELWLTGFNGLNILKKSTFHLLEQQSATTTWLLLE